MWLWRQEGMEMEAAPDGKLLGKEADEDSDNDD